ncbi:hypothetical protein HGM15179_012155, partial [Zosterops borbonicus]
FPFRAVEVLSCDITLHRGKLESPARCFTPLTSQLWQRFDPSPPRRLDQDVMVCSDADNISQ